MGYPRYQEYLNSGVEWLGETPSTWTIKRVGYFFNERREKVSDKDFQPLSVTKNGIVPQLESAAKSDDGDNRKKVCIGDFVINSRSDRKGSSGASALDGSVSLINTVIVPNENIDIKFAHNLFRSKAFQEEYYRYGKGIVADLWSTNYSEMKNISIPIPPLKEQSLIADFLEKETAKIDFLVAEQEKLIELLKEKRQAVISHAVTQGLEPKVKLKDSGVDWLGDVPDHWEVKKIRYLLNEKNGLVRGPFGGDLKKEIFVKDGIKVLEQKNAIYQDITLGDSFITEEKFGEMKRFEVFPGDYIMSCSGTIGKTYRIPEGSQPAIINQALMIMRFKNKISNEYLDWIFQANFFVNQILDNSQGGAMKNLVGMDIFTAITLPCPPLDEQIAISCMLSKKMTEFDLLTRESTTVVNILKERRSALISAAVTGQIDVRNYQSKEAA